MARSANSLCALLGSRICHDLISPIGAIGNGVELLGMAGGSSGPELELINASTVNANARIRFFRIAYGQAGAEQRIGRSEMVAVLKDYYVGTRMHVQWALTEGCSRSEARLALVLLQCLESAMPLGGNIHISRTDTAWRLQADADKTRITPELWDLLTEGDNGELNLTANQVQFALAPIAAKELGRTIRADISDRRMAVTF